MQTSFEIQAFLRKVQYFLLLRKLNPEVNLASVSMGVGHILPEEERLVFLKPVVQLSFTYGVLKGLLYNY